MPNKEPKKPPPYVTAREKRERVILKRVLLEEERGNQPLEKIPYFLNAKLTFTSKGEKASY